MSAHRTVWIDVCALDDICPDTGVCALVEERQIAIFRVGSRERERDGVRERERDGVREPAPHCNRERVYALGNFDPKSRAFVLARGIVGESGGALHVASPMYKERFALASGECLDDPSVRVPVYPVRVRGGRVEVAVEPDPDRSMTRSGRVEVAVEPDPDRSMSRSEP